MRFAVADGATEAMLSGLWADVLTKRFGRHPAKDIGITALLESSYPSWEKTKAAYLKGREHDKKPIQWYEEPALEAGAFATFLGIQFQDSKNHEGRSWRCMAVGDACLFLIRADQVQIRFPVETSNGFSNTPDLLSSNPARNRTISGRVKEVCGEWQAGDQFYLMTDAISCWFLKEVESGKNPWKQLSSFLDSDYKDGFADWLGGLRTAKEMRNDDVTLLRVAFED